MREAMRKLEQEGLVVMIPRRGAQVASITEKDLNDVLEVRIALENVAIEKACKLITEEELGSSGWQPRNLKKQKQREIWSVWRKLMWLSTRSYTRLLIISV